MNLTYETIIAIFKQAQATQFNSWDLPMSLSLQLSRVFGKLTKEAEVFEKERMKLVERYAEKDEDGNVKQDESGNAVLTDYDGFASEYREMLEEEIDVGFEPLKIDFTKLEDRGILKKPSEISWMIPILDESCFGG